MPVAGRGAEFEPIASRCRAEKKRSFALVRIMVRFCDVPARTYIGDLDLAEQCAVDCAELSAAGNQLPWETANAMTGLVGSCRGKVPDVITYIEQAGATLQSGAFSALAVICKAAAGEGVCGATWT